MKLNVTVAALITLILAGTLSAQSSGPLIYFPFNGNADDESGNGRHGTVQGAALTEDRFGTANSAYMFNGIDNYIEYPVLWSAPPTALSMSAWFMVSSDEEGKILYHGDKGEFQLLAIGDTAEAAVHLTNGWYFTVAEITTGTWHFIAAVWEKGNRLELYLDNESADTLFVPDKDLIDVGVDYPPSIGSYRHTGGYYFGGIIDEVRVYDRALSLSEIDSLYNEGSTPIAETGKSMPDNFRLFRNFPNPFNPSTTITWQTAAAAQNTLEIYDITGKRVAVILDEYKPAGTYAILFNGEDMSSGVYLCRLKAGNFEAVEKLLLMK